MRSSPASCSARWQTCFWRRSSSRPVTPFPWLTPSWYLTGKQVGWIIPNSVLLLENLTKPEGQSLNYRYRIKMRPCSFCPGCSLYISVECGDLGALKSLWKHLCFLCWTQKLLKIWKAQKWCGKGCVCICAFRERSVVSFHKILQRVDDLQNVKHWSDSCV